MFSPSFLGQLRTTASITEFLNDLDLLSAQATLADVDARPHFANKMLKKIRAFLLPAEFAALEEKVCFVCVSKCVS